MPTRSYWPCKLIAHEAYHSIVFGDFDLLVHHFGGRDAGGYGVEGLAKKLARAKDPKLLKRVKFDSEASLPNNPRCDDGCGGLSAVTPSNDCDCQLANLVRLRELAGMDGPQDEIGGRGPVFVILSKPSVELTLQFRRLLDELSHAVDDQDALRVSRNPSVTQRGRLECLRRARSRTPTSRRCLRT